MGNFIGGSAYAMANQVAEGYLLVTERTFRRLSPGELGQLGLEIDKRLREIRGETVPVGSETQEIQKRQRKLQRLSGCRQMLASYRQRRRI
ncbi:MAG: hypothetical protein AAGN46_16220 [Acidobacteriota bacterium]